MNEYRACWFIAESGDETRLTDAEQINLTDDELTEAAIVEGYRRGLIGAEWPSVPEHEFRSRLTIGYWRERG